MLKKLFGFDATQTTVKTEIVAGVTTFLTMSYILAVNPSIFSQLEGMPGGAVFTSTAIAAIIGCLAMAFIGKMPFGLAPGMGLNAFFVYSVCLGMGYSWQFALTAVFIEGLIFILLTLTNVREAIVKAIPMNLRNAIGAGIGLFIAFIGLASAGVVVHNDATLVALGDITTGSALLTLIGLVVTGFLYAKKIPGSILIGIIITMIIGISMDVTEFKGIMSQPESIEPIFCKFEFDNVFTLDMLVVVFTFLFIDMFDTMGTFVGVCTKSNMVDEKGNINRINEAFMADSIATTAGAMLGTSTTTTYVESAAGVAQGGRSGLTAFTVACCFVVALFFSPLFLSIPAAATAPALIIVGLLMIEPVVRIPFDDVTEAIPAFVCIIMMPLTHISGLIGDFSLHSGVAVKLYTIRQLGCQQVVNLDAVNFSAKHWTHVQYHNYPPPNSVDIKCDNTYYNRFSLICQ